MKIEIGESLIASYLNHVEQCKIVQTNWKVSGNWAVGDHDKAIAKELFNKVLTNDLLSSIFKENTFEQLLKQAEIDVLGINTLENTVYGYDIAFHSLGLNYKGNEGTCEVVIKKIFRAIFAMQIYFPEFDKIESFFAAPKVNRKLDGMLNGYIEEARNVIDNDNIRIGYLSNDSFYENIVDKVVNSVKTESDTSELFVRALKLLQLDKRVIKSNSEITLATSKVARPVIITDKKTVNGMKIGQYVKNSFYDLANSNKLSDAEIIRLQDPAYCNETFKINYEVLRKNSKPKVDANGRNRYYKEEVVKGYWLCSQWVENQWDNFLAWEKKFKFKSD